MPLATLLLLASFAPAQDDPLPIRREIVPPARLAAELDRVCAGALVRMPRDEFERRVRRAALAVAAREQPPRLAAVRLRGRWADGGLVGTGTLTVAASGPGVVGVEPLSLALGTVRWANGGPAVLADLDGRPQSPGLELLVEPPAGDLLFDWSLRSTTEPTGTRFDVRLPPTAVATLDLDLPAGADLLPPRGGSRTGPTPLPSGEERWRVLFGGTATLELTVRFPNDAPAQPVVLAAARHTATLSQGEAACEWAWDATVGPGGVRELIVDHDPAARPTDAQARGLDRWEPAGDGRVRLLFREPFVGGTVTVRGVAPWQPGQPWAWPSATLAGAADRGADLTLTVPPDVRLDDFAPGGWRIVAVTAGDRGQTITLRATLPRTDIARPRGVPQAAGPEYGTRERHQLHVEPERTTLTSAVTVAARRGAVYAVPFALPAGWTFERVESQPPDLEPTATATGGTLTVQLLRPIPAGQEATLTLHLRRPGVRAATRLPFPDLAPAGAKPRDGTFAWRVGPLLDATATTALMSADGALRFAGPVEGALDLRPRTGGLEATGDAALLDTPDGPVWRQRLTFTPRDGAPDATLLATAAPLPRGHTWHTLDGANRVTRCDPLDDGRLGAGLLAGFALGQWRALAPLAARAAPRLYRVAFAQPLTTPLTVECQFPWPGDDRPPLVWLPTAAIQLHRVSVPAGRGFAPHGLRPDPAPADAMAWTYTAGPVRLDPQPATPPPTRIDNATLTATFDGSGMLHARLAFDLRHAGPTLPLHWPAHVTPRAARVAGATAALAGGRLPVPAGAGPHRAELEWSQPASSGWLVAALRADLPGLPVPLDPATTWRVPAGWQPLLAGAATPEIDGDGTAVVARDAAPTLRVANVALVWAAGIAVVAATLALWLARPAAGRRVAAAGGLLAGVAACFVAAPFIVALVPIVVIGAAAIVRLPRRTAAAALLVAGVGQASAPPPAVVYLLPGDGPAVALVPADLLDRLAALERGPAPTGAVVLATAVSGRVADGTADLRLELDVLNPVAEPAALDVPLAGAAVRGWRLDGKPAFPQAVGDRYRTTLPPGPHRLTLDVAVPLAGSAAEPELRFTLPDAAVTTLDVLLPAGARGATAPQARGTQRTTDTPDGVRCEARLGRTATVAVRWHAPAPTARPKASHLFLWDVTDAAATLTGAIRYSTISPLDGFTVAVPPGLEVAAVAARAADGGATAAIAGWRVTDAADGRRLRVDLAAPVRGTWLLALDLVPRDPPGATLTLAYPTPLDADSAGHLLAYRAAGVTATPRRAGDWQPMADDDFLKQHWLPARLERAPRPITKAFRRPPVGGGPPPTLALATLTPRWRGTPTATWTLGPTRADVTVEAELTADAGAPPVVEWDIPAAMRVDDVIGPGVLAWSRGGRLQVWLAAGAAATVRWHGSLLRAGTAERWAMPLVRLVGPPPAGPALLTPRDGYTLTPLGPTIPAGPGGRSWAAAAEATGPRPAFALRPAAGSTEFALDTTLDAAGTATTTVVARVKAGELRSVVLATPDVAGWAATLDAGPATATDEAGRPGERRWRLDWPAGTAGEQRFTLRQSRRDGSPAVVPLPHLRFGDAPAAAVEHRLTTAWAVTPAPGLTPAGDGRWRVAPTVPTVAVRPAATTTQPAVEVVAAERGEAFDHRGHRRSRIGVRVRHAGGESLQVTWPQPVRPDAVRVGDGDLPPPPSAVETLAVPLPRAGGTVTIEVSWPAAPDEPFGLPALAADGRPIAPPPATQAVSLPPDWRRAGDWSDGSPPTRPLPAGDAAGRGWGRPATPRWWLRALGAVGLLAAAGLARRVVSPR